MGAMKALAGLALGIVVLGGTAVAAVPPTRDQVRVKLLDQCVLSQSGKSDSQGAGPKCTCYAAKISKAMTDEEVAKFKKGIPKRLAPDAQTALATCK
ncbi:hypothetical protein IZ6_16000 [Terrihabitans soli]|uniref:Uncharacterized protein n=1 Tax=Terrihabitans soli TaxID=708113 RepID=A0A6S6QTD7_9HYPH|nr:hypothetical protein [Terrihabitans soli]BCJ90865.1 hypothetical protein IZ6_16000 [Terrihabitans soli]